MNTLQDEFINIFIIVFFQILTSLIVVKRQNVSISKGLKRLATSEQPGRDDKLAQNIYTMVESFFNNKFGQDLSRKSSSCGEESSDIDKKSRNHSRIFSKGRERNGSKVTEEEIKTSEKMETEEFPIKFKTKRGRVRKKDRSNDSKSSSRRGSQRGQSSPDNREQQNGVKSISDSSCDERSGRRESPKKRYHSPIESVIDEHGQSFEIDKNKF